MSGVLQLNTQGSVAVTFGSIEMFIEKLSKLAESPVQLALLRSRNARIRHHPIGHEMTLKKSLRKAKRLRPRKKQFLCLLNFFLSLRVELVHQSAIETMGHEL